MKPINTLTIAVVPAMALLLAGCSSTENYHRQALLNPSLAGGAIRVAAEKTKGTVESFNPNQRTVVLKSEAGQSTECRVSESVMNLDQLVAGTAVKAKIVTEEALFLNNAQLPAGGPGVSDYKTTIYNLDRSYRLLSLVYPEDEHRDYKVPLGTELKTVNPGDEAVVRSTLPLLVEFKTVGQ